MTESRAYTFDTALNIWITPFHDGIGYSDGDAVEHRLLEALRKCRDLSAASEELRARITDWPSEYHLSPVRHNLLRPFEFKRTDFVLELGCGCGAMTRYLGETGATVIAVEGSRRRAAIASERCRDLPNVSVYCENLVEFKADRRFDFVTLIGVLEYSRLFISGEDPVQICLEKSGNFLVENGSLVLAIENQLGLKYFNGSCEDHTGIPYFGINDLYGKETPVTFGRYELVARLHRAGFGNLSFNFPFPDYKFPEVILSEAAINRQDFNTADLLFRSYSREYGGRSFRAFQENMAWFPLARNGLIQDLANSFLVMGHRGPYPVQRRANWLCSSYSTGRLPRFSTETTFQVNGAAVEVAKKLLYPKNQFGDTKDGCFFHHPSPHATYVCGHLYALELQLILTKGEGLAAVAQWAVPWVNFVVAAAVPGTGNVLLLPRTFLDAIPTNMVRNHVDKLVAIDFEWESAAPIPLNWVLIRGMVYALASCSLSQALVGNTFRGAVSEIFSELGRPLADQDFEVASDLEDAFLNMVCGSCSGRRLFSEMLNSLLFSANPQVTFYQEITFLKNELCRVKATISWRLTKPLRLLGSIARFLRDFILRKCRFDL